MPPLAIPSDLNAVASWLLRDLAAVQSSRQKRYGFDRAASAVDSDAHGPDELVYAETALAHARLAGIPSERIVNCWPWERVRDWLDASR